MIAGNEGAREVTTKGAGSCRCESISSRESGCHIKDCKKCNAYPPIWGHIFRHDFGENCSDPRYGWAVKSEETS